MLKRNQISKQNKYQSNICHNLKHRKPCINQELKRNQISKQNKYQSRIYHNLIHRIFGIWLNCYQQKYPQDNFKSLRNLDLKLKRSQISKQNTYQSRIYYNLTHRILSIRLNQYQQTFLQDNFESLRNLDQKLKRSQISKQNKYQYRIYHNLKQCKFGKKIIALRKNQNYRLHIQRLVYIVHNYLRSDISSKFLW